MLFPAVEEVLANISAADPAVAPLLTATHSASDLRLYAGLIISKFAGPMVRGERVTLGDVGLIESSRPVVGSHRLLLTSISLANIGNQTRDAVGAMEQHYFGAGQRLIDGLIAEALDKGQFSITPMQLLAASGPSLQVWSPCATGCLP